MANISETVVPQTNPGTSVQGCYFLDELPVELRLSIYEFFFEGSKIHATLADNDESSFTQDAAVIMRHSEHFKLLLSCRKIYNEALATYWSKTILRLKCPTPLVLSFHTGHRSARLKAHKDAYCLCTSLPEAVKANVKHIRGILLQELKSPFVEANPSLTASALLGTFKELVTCELNRTFFYSLDIPVACTLSPKNKGFSRFKMKWAPQEPMDYLAHLYGINATTGVVFLCRDIIWPQDDTYDSRKYWDLKPIWPRFWNFSTGLVFEDVTGKLDFEEGYEKVMQGSLYM